MTQIQTKLHKTEAPLESASFRRKMAPKFLSIIFLLVLIFDKGHSLKCYKCSTFKDQNNACTDLSKGRESVTTEDCHDGEVCAVYTVKNPATGSNTISRSCSPKDICTTFHTKETDFKKLVDCHVCTTDLCDSGKTIGASVLILLLVLILGSFIA